MSFHVSNLFALSLEPKDFPAFEALVSEIAAATEKELGTLICEYSVNAGRTVAHILERYRSDSAVVYGSPDAEVRKRLDPFAAAYMESFGRFSRECVV